MSQNDAHIVLLPGDGIGPEVIEAAKSVLDVVSAIFGLEFSFDEIPCGGAYYLEHGRDWPETAESRCAAADAILLGAVGAPSPDGPGPVMRVDGRMAGYSAVLGNRQRLDLFANIRPVRRWSGLNERGCDRFSSVWTSQEVNLVILRENTEGLYVEAGSVVRPGGLGQAAVDTRLITRRASERICRLAFELANKRRNSRSSLDMEHITRVTAVTKHNVLEGCKLFAEVFREIGSEYPHLSQDIMLVDAFAPALMQKPGAFDVVVTTNLFGDILTDLASVLQGGMGMAVGCNIGMEHAMFEPIHGSAPDIAGQGCANPLAMILAAAEMLRWLAARKNSLWSDAADAIEGAVQALILEGGPLTPDLARGHGSSASTMEVASAVAAQIRRLS